MKRLNLIMVCTLAVTLLAGNLLTSCGDDSVDPCNAQSFEGTWFGFYSIAGLIPLPNGDSLIVSVNGNVATITSTLAQSTFTATYNEVTGKMEIAAFTADIFVVGNDTLFDVAVESGSGQISSDCETLFINLENLSIQDGTIDLDIIGGYPVTNIDVRTQNNKPFKQVP